MSPLSRRTLLRSGASIGIALPFLDAMVRPSRQAQAQGRPKRLFIMVGQNGVVPSTFFPTGGTEKAFTLGASLAPLEPHKSNLIILDGIRKMQRGLTDGTAHGRGSAGAITGATCSGKNGIGDGPSIDHPIADVIGQGTRYRNLIVGAVNQYGWFYTGPKQKVFGEDSPAKNYERLFSNFSPPAAGGGAGPNPDISKLIARKKSILDAALDEYKKLASTVGTADKARLDVHQDAIRNVEKGIATLGESSGMASAACAKPAAAADPMAFNDKATANLELVALAFACDITRIGGMQYNTHGVSFPWAGVTGGDHHALAHQQGSAGIDANLTKANAWFASQYGLVINKLKSYSEAGGGNVFDETLMLWTNELAIGPHKFDRGPFLLASGGLTLPSGKKLETGRWLKYDNFPHTGVLISMANMFGLNITKFGYDDPSWQKGPLPGLI
jgi:hypothetical protein